MKAEKYRHFYANACHICRQFGIPLVRCSFCKIIAYCSEKHQQQHMLQHMKLCAIYSCAGIYPSDRIIEEKYNSGRAWRKFKENCIRSVEDKLGRSLFMYEREMFLFSKGCIICHKRDDLVDCSHCASVSYCANHMVNLSSNNHSCDKLKLCFELDALPKKYPDLSYIKHMPDKISYCNDRNGCSRFFNDYIKPYISSNIETEETMVAIHSEYITRPLTLLYTVKEINYNINYKELYIHLINSSYMDVRTKETWEILLHTELQLKRIYITMIGPELKKRTKNIKLCDKCLSQGKRIKFIFSPSYEEYVHQPHFVKPHLVIGFNVTIHLDQLKYHVIQDHAGISLNLTPWMNIIHMLLTNTLCPLIFTSYTYDEAMNDLTEMYKITQNQICHLRTLQNAYSSLKPYRDPETELPSFLNSFSTIYFKP